MQRSTTLLVLASLAASTAAAAETNTLQGTGAAEVRRLVEAGEAVAAHHPSACIACCACKLYMGSEYCSAADCGDGSGGFCWSPRHDNYGKTCKGSPKCEGACKYEVPQTAHRATQRSASRRLGSANGNAPTAKAGGSLAWLSQHFAQLRADEA